MKNIAFLLLTFFSLTAYKASACTACQGLSGITQNINGTNLELDFVSNAGWQCCYTVQIEIVCASANFTGVPNYFSPELCINGGTAASSTWSNPEPYQTTVIDLSTFCPGTYKWRAQETVCGLGWTDEMTFEVTGASPMVIDISASETLICLGESSQITSLASNGCNGPYSYSWSPSAGLNNASIANPLATPTQTTTYTVTVTEPGSCAVTQTANITIDVNPLPTASVSDNVAVCLNEAGPTVTFTGAGGTAPYTINYNINGVAQTAIVTTGDTYTVTAPTNTAGLYDYQLVNVTDATSTLCSQNQSTYITVTVWDLPIIGAGNDVEICEPNSTSPSEVTLNGSGGVSYDWDNSVNNGEAFVPPSGVTVYTVTGMDINGCTNTDQVTVTAFPLPIANAVAGPLYGNVPLTTTFNNLSQNAILYDWDFGNGDTQNTNSILSVSTTYTTPGTYTVIMTASNGICYDTWTIDIEALPPMVVTPPNVFTPNGDGSNDQYFVNVLYGDQFEAMIFNRWGNEMATLNSINQGWDGKTKGKDVEDGVYFIKYKATDFSGVSVEGHTYFHLVR